MPNKRRKGLKSLRRIDNLSQKGKHNQVVWSANRAWSYRHWIAFKERHCLIWAVSNFALGKPHLAIQNCERALEMSPGYIDAWYLKRELLEITGESAKLREASRKIEELEVTQYNSEELLRSYLKKIK